MWNVRCSPSWIKIRTINQIRTKANLEIINFRMNQKRKRSSPRWNWFAMFSTYLRFVTRFSRFVLFYWKNIFSNKDYENRTSHACREKKDGKKKKNSLQWKRGIRSMSKKNARLTNRSRDVMTHLHNALHPLERQVVIELHNIYTHIYIYQQ